MDKPKATDNLISLLTSLDASTKVNIPPNLLQPLNPSIISKSLVIKVITNKSFRKAQLRESIMAAWNLRNNVIFKDYGTDVFLVTFESKDDLEKVYRNGPWTFKGDFIGMEVCRPMTSPSSYEFNSINLWVQISGLPCDLVSIENLEHIVKPIGKLKSQSTMDLAKWGSYVRVKVEHNVAKPLTGTLIIPLTNNSSTELKIQYEKLERFCRFCGILGHEMEDCKLLEEVNERLADEDTTEKAKSILRSLCVDRFTDNLKAPIWSNRSRRVQGYANSTQFGHGGGAEAEVREANQENHNETQLDSISAIHVADFHQTSAGAQHPNNHNQQNLIQQGIQNSNPANPTFFGITPRSEQIAQLATAITHELFTSITANINPANFSFPFRPHSSENIPRTNPQIPSITISEITANKESAISNQSPPKVKAMSLTNVDNCEESEQGMGGGIALYKPKPNPDLNPSYQQVCTRALLETRISSFQVHNSGDLPQNAAEQKCTFQTNKQRLSKSRVSLFANQTSELMDITWKQSGKRTREITNYNEATSIRGFKKQKYTKDDSPLPLRDTQMAEAAMQPRQSP